MSEEELYGNYNTDGILMRSVIAGLLDLLNNKINYSQTWGDNIIEKVEVPWMYDMGSSDERFMQDNYTFFGKSCFGDGKINGTFNSIPRGVIKYTGSQIESGSITNRFIQGTYLKNIEGRLVSYTSFLYSMPLNVSIECEMFIDNLITGFKIEQAIRETFYKNKTFYVLFRGMRIGCTVGFPENIGMEKTTSYAFDTNDRTIKLKFSLGIETYQPVFDPTTEMERSNYIRGIGMDVFVKAGDDSKMIRVLNKSEDVVYPSGGSYLLEWEYKSMDSDMCNVSVLYKDNLTGEEKYIEHVLVNQSSYIWNIPEKFSKFEQPLITYGNDVIVKKNPVIKIIPNKVTGYIDENSFVVLSNGYFLTNKEYINFTIEFTDHDENIKMADNYYLKIDNNEIDLEHPVDIDGDPIKYSGKMKYRDISLIVRYTNDSGVCDESANLLIL